MAQRLAAGSADLEAIALDDAADVQALPRLAARDLRRGRPGAQGWAAGPQRGRRPAVIRLDGAEAP